MSMNCIMISGRLVADPEVKNGNGVEFTTFTVAVDRNQKEKKTDFIPCTAFDKVGQVIEQYFHKGDRITVQGQLNGDRYEKDGKKLTFWKVKVEKFDFVENKNSENKVTEPAEIADDDFPF